MVGFDDGTERVYSLDDLPVQEINPDLTATINLTTARRLVENRDICFMGPSAKGPFDIDQALERR
jgi:hypothetical protein